MTSNTSLELSIQINKMLQQDLTSAFYEEMPYEMIESFAKQYEVTNGDGKTHKFRDKVYNLSNTFYTMGLTAFQEDKSLQQSVVVFKNIYEHNCKNIREKEAAMLKAERQFDKKQIKKAGRPKEYRSKIAKSKTNNLSLSTAAFSNARARLPYEMLERIYTHSTDFGEFDRESWHGLKTHITDGTYLQLQDTESIRKEYPPIEGDGAYPQALLQVFIRQGSGQVSQIAIGNRKQSELELVVPMIKKLNGNDLLLADDLYNTYYHFCLILNQKSHIIVPGKRDRNYTVVRQIASNDEIVKIKKGRKPPYVGKEEWSAVPSSIELRRIGYTYPTKNGDEQAVLYTTLVDEKITSTDVILKYEKRWEIEICIREIKTVMDINVLRSKSPDMIKKELTVSLTAYNLIRKLIAKSAVSADFPPRRNIFQKCVAIDSPILLDKKGRVFHHWSPGRNKKTVDTNQ
jgi:hypothetical protein